VVIQGDALTIEFQESGVRRALTVSAGLADWEGPESLAHRAINSGVQTFEEVVTFYRAHPDQEPQPEA
jgi:hypothetical protein